MLKAGSFSQCVSIHDSLQWCTLEKGSKIQGKIWNVGFLSLSLFLMVTCFGLFYSIVSPSTYLTIYSLPKQLLLSINSPHMSCLFVSLSTQSTHFTSLAMELFSRRRWTTGSAQQQSNMYGNMPCMCCLILWGLLNTQQLTHTWYDTAFISLY